MKKKLVFILILIFFIQLGFSDIANTGNKDDSINIKEIFTKDGIAINQNIETKNFNNLDLNKVTLYDTKEKAEEACSSKSKETEWKSRCIQTKYQETSNTQNRKDKFYSKLVKVRYVSKEYIVPIYQCSKYDFSSLDTYFKGNNEYYIYPDDYDIKNYPCLERDSDEIEGYICNYETRIEEDKKTTKFCGYAETSEDLKCSELGDIAHCVPEGKEKTCECISGDIEEENHDCSEYSEEGGIVYESQIFTRIRTCNDCYWSMWKGDKLKDKYCKILECPSGKDVVSTPFGDICFPYQTKKIGSDKASGTKNMVEFCGIKNGKSMNVRASCEGNWEVDPCNWKSSCDTGWEYEDSNIYAGCSHTCPIEITENEPPTTINIGSQTSSGINNRVILCGLRNGISTSGIATCSGNWEVDPCNWKSSCDTGWEYNPSDYKKNKCLAQCPKPKPKSINIGSQTSSGINNIIVFCGSKGTGKAFCEGNWYINPGAWESSCDTGWEYNPSDYGHKCGN